MCGVLRILHSGEPNLALIGGVLEGNYSRHFSFQIELKCKICRAHAFFMTSHISG